MIRFLKKNIRFINFIVLGIVSCLFFLLLTLNNQAVVSQLVTYESPEQAIAAKDFRVKVNRSNIFVYDNLLEERKYNGANSINAPVTYFSFTGKARISVSANETVKDVDIRPKSLNIKPKVKGKTVSFNITKPCNLSIEINKNSQRPLLLFANPLETNIPDPKDPNVVYFEGGKVYDVGQINNDRTDGKIVYIAGGAIVKGQVVANKASNFKLLGRGILQTKDDANTIWMQDVDNVEVDGPILINNQDQWTYHTLNSNNVSINNLKVLSSIRDGIDITSSQNVTVNKSFVMALDDAICIKATPLSREEIVDNIKVSNSVIWNVGGGNSLEIGYETLTDSISNVVFSNLDIIHSESNSEPWPPEAIMSIHLANQAMVKDISYDNIRIEDAQEDYLIDLRIWKNYLHRNTERGNIKNISFENIKIVDNSPFPPSAFNGFDLNHKITEVAILGLWNNGKKVESKKQAKFQINQYASNISLK